MELQLLLLKWKIIDTSMGFTPLAGVTTGTRSGDIDASLLPFLMEKEGIKNINDMIYILNNKSGLKGLSGISSDMRDLEDAEATNEDAALALRIFEDRVRKYIGSYAATMNGLEVAIVFTAGIGENGVETRENIINGLTFLGAELDPEKNNVRGKERFISKENSKVKVLLVPTDEEVMIARDVEKLK